MASYNLTGLAINKFKWNSNSKKLLPLHLSCMHVLGDRLTVPSNLSYNQPQKYI